MSKEIENLYERLQRAKDEELKIKLLVLQMLHLNGIIAFDASSSVLNEEIAPLIKGKG